MLEAVVQVVKGAAVAVDALTLYKGPLRSAGLCNQIEGEDLAR
jgi:hypothetical protein